MQKIGILGGSFNPIHNGHVLLARTALTEYKLDKVLIMPNSDTYYKKDASISDEDRYRMIELAIDGIEGLEPSDIELKRGGITYTIDTIRELKKVDRENHVRNKYYFIIGGDSLKNLYYWREIRNLFRSMTFLAAIRDDVDKTGLEEIKQSYIEKYKDVKIEFLSCDAKNISSSSIRKSVLEGKDISNLVPASVYGYIKEKGLYLQGAEV
ncbi:MAG: nicotinate-nucleotide adenylyltransferase [Eubacterium sp.]|nr:nicotinate-nucleotide adenylyltransferase [Eubacterium sp.]